MNKQALRQLESRRNFQDKEFKALCYAPWVQMSFYPNGLVSACCSSRREPLGNVREQSLREIWNGERTRAFREQLRRYRFPGGCRSCELLLDAGRIDGHQIHDFDGFPVTAGDTWPARLEFALSNTCNLACIMCSGTFSSVIRAKEGLPPMVPAYGERFFTDLAEFLPHARSLSFLGGEPFLQKECYRIWDMLIAADHRLPCHVTTNGSVWNAKVERVLKELPFSFSISIDGVRKQTVEAIRLNVDFDTLMANVLHFRDYLHAAGRPQALQVNFCVLRSNWQELPEFFSWAEGLGAVVWTSIVAGPDLLSVLTLPRAELEKIVGSLRASEAELAPRLPVNAGRFRDVVRQLEARLQGDAATFGETDDFGVAAGGLARAYALADRGDVEGAILSASAVDVGDSDWYSAQALVGGLATDRGEFARAESSLAAAMAKEPQRPEGPLRLAWLRLVQERVSDAAAVLADVRGRIGEAWCEVPEIGEGLLLLEARVARQQGDLALARRRVEDLLSRNPDHAAGRTLFRELPRA